MEQDQEVIHAEEQALSEVRPQSLALDEYKETLAFLRHDDQMMWTILGLSGTVTLGLWVFALKAVFWSAKAVATSGLGVFALCLGRLMASRITAYTKSRKKRADELEQILGFKLMSELHNRMPKMIVPGINRLLDSVMLASFIAWILYFLAYWSLRK